ncbi:MAG: SOS response-associated peptidase [Deltaproteobacteria bacterium]|nr:SOS response-associated peptidase [Deltaproteobacteria bacterium]
MCGRFTLTSPAQIIAEMFGVEPPEGLVARYNVCPGQAVGVVRARDGERRTFGLLRWGLVPHWSNEIPRDASLINARMETVAEKPAFRDAFRSRRCLVPADSFFEWRTEVGVKQPYLIRRRDQKPFAIAGVWESWRRGDSPRLESCALVTTEPNELVRPIHDRMPALLPSDAWDLWLDPSVGDPVRLLPLLRPTPASEMELFPVSPRVNSPANDDPTLLAREPPRTLFDLG